MAQASKLFDEQKNQGNVVSFTLTVHHYPPRPMPSLSVKSGEDYQS